MTRPAKSATPVAGARARRNRARIRTAARHRARRRRDLRRATGVDRFRRSPERPRPRQRRDRALDRRSRRRRDGVRRPTPVAARGRTHPADRRRDRSGAEDADAGHRGDPSGMAWAEGTLWVGDYAGGKIHQIDPDSGAVLRAIESDRFVTGVSWIDGELWHGTGSGPDEPRRGAPDRSAVRRCRCSPGVPRRCCRQRARGGGRGSPVLRRRHQRQAPRDPRGRRHGSPDGAVPIDEGRSVGEPSRVNRGVVIAVVVLLAGAAAIVGWRESHRAPAAAPVAAPVPPPAPPPPAVAPDAAPPGIRHPVPDGERQGSAVAGRLRRVRQKGARRSGWP